MGFGFGVWGGLAFSEEVRPHPYHGGPLGDGHFQIGRHAHVEVVERFASGRVAEGIAQATQSRKSVPGGLGGRARRGQGHQPHDSNPGQGGTAIQQLGQGILRTTRFALLSAQVHLQANVDDVPGRQGPPGQGPGQPNRVHRIHGAEDLEGLGRLVALKMADHSPAGRGGRGPGKMIPQALLHQGMDCSSRLDVVLAEIAEPRADCGGNPIDGLMLTSPHQGQLRRVSPRARACGFDALAHGRQSSAGLGQELGVEADAHAFSRTARSAASASMARVSSAGSPITLDSLPIT